jgi:hypothetical protein
LTLTGVLNASGVGCKVKSYRFDVTVATAHESAAHLALNASVVAAPTQMRLPTPTSTRTGDPAAVTICQLERQHSATREHQLKEHGIAVRSQFLGCPVVLELLLESPTDEKVFGLGPCGMSTHRLITYKAA